jgi:hypothetical protein
MGSWILPTPFLTMTIYGNMVLFMSWTPGCGALTM